VLKVAKSTKDKRIKAEFDRLNKIYQDLPGNELELIQPLLRNAAFMKITLDDLSESINQNGATEDYKNGENQFGRKASADLQSYNATFKNYVALMIKLRDRLPAEKTDSKLEALMNIG